MIIRFISTYHRCIHLKWFSHYGYSGDARLKNISKSDIFSDRFGDRFN